MKSLCKRFVLKPTRLQPFKYKHTYCTLLIYGIGEKLKFPGWRSSNMRNSLNLLASTIEFRVFEFIDHWLWSLWWKLAYGMLRIVPNKWFMFQPLITEVYLLASLRRVLSSDIRKFQIEGSRIISNLAARRTILVVLWIHWIKLQVIIYTYKCYFPVFDY